MTKAIHFFKPVVAIGHVRTYWKIRINQRIDLDRLEMLANKYHTSVGAEVVEHFLITK